MPTCPLCKKPLRQPVRECPGCRADLSLLADYAAQLERGLARAQELTRAGELGEAVWAYLEVLEADPEQPAARRQVGRVAAAVRHFDRAAGRRTALPFWVGVLAWGCVAVLAFGLGYWLGQRAGVPPAAPPGTNSRPADENRRRGVQGVSLARDVRLAEDDRLTDEEIANR
jgi:hypothetical protein